MQKRFRFLCNLHTVNPDYLPFPTRTYLGQVGYVTIYPRGQGPVTTKPATTKPSGTTPAPSPSSSAVLMVSFGLALLALVLPMF